jgi:hypothetical protein
MESLRTVSSNLSFSARAPTIQKYRLHTVRILRVIPDETAIMGACTAKVHILSK